MKLSSLGEKTKPTAMDYYAVSMLTLIILYSSITGAHAIKSERVTKTINRLICSPAKKYQIFIGKIFGSLAITILQVLIVIVVSKYVLKAYWGSHVGIVLLLVGAEIIMAVSMGIAVSFLVKNESGVLNILVPLIAFFGGAYGPVEMYGANVLRFSDLSPLRWINKATFSVIYSNDFSTVGAAIGINLCVAVIFIVIASLHFRKEAL